MLIPHGAHVMVVDGARMAIFRNNGKNSAPQLELIEEKEQSIPRSSALGTDQPGRSRENLGSVGGAHQSTDFHQIAEDQFAAAAAERLDSLLQPDKARAILVAAPKVLAIMRKHLRVRPRAKIIAEIDRDYAGRSAKDVARLLSSIHS